jgi:hypothetical protein
MLTRRDFVGQLAAAGAAVGALAMAPGTGLLTGTSASSRQTCRQAVPFHEVVSFHMDQPYIDPTGAATPYRPPRGARSAAPVARFSEEAFRRMQCYA